jgi:hypothetical protein
MTYFNSEVVCSFIKPDTQTMMVIEKQSDFNVFKWVEDNKHLLEKYIIKHDGILLRNFSLCSISEFNKIVQIISPNLLDYVYQSTPRTKLGGKIYTATEYPANRFIPLHNENSYTKIWPRKIFFFSIIVAEEGGETPIASSRNVYKSIDKTVKEKFEKNGIMYIRNYTNGIDLKWQDVFQTNKRSKVDAFCKNGDIQVQWNNSEPELTTKEVCQASIIHPDTSEPVWFNQAHLFHFSALSSTDFTSLINLLGENNIPRNAFYGDGNPIELEYLEHIRKVYNEEKIKFRWQKGDIMILDNILTAHAREAFKGNRKIVVAMA